MKILANKNCIQGGAKVLLICSEIKILLLYFSSGNKGIRIKADFFNFQTDNNLRREIGKRINSAKK
jgi:hypothetical protein